MRAWYWPVTKVNILIARSIISDVTAPSTDPAKAERIKEFHLHPQNNY